MLAASSGSGCRLPKPRPLRLDDGGFFGRCVAQLLEQRRGFAERLPRLQLAWLPAARCFARVVSQALVIARRFVIVDDHLIAEQLPVVAQVAMQPFRREGQKW